MKEQNKSERNEEYVIYAGIDDRLERGLEPMGRRYTFQGQEGKSVFVGNRSLGFSGEESFWETPTQCGREMGLKEIRKIRPHFIRIINGLLQLGKIERFDWIADRRNFPDNHHNYVQDARNTCNYIMQEPFFLQNVWRIEDYDISRLVRGVGESVFHDGFELVQVEGNYSSRVQLFELRRTERR